VLLCSAQLVQLPNIFLLKFVKKVHYRLLMDVFGDYTKKTNSIGGKRKEVSYVPVPVL
jgi:hypothetical protein